MVESAVALEGAGQHLKTRVALLMIPVGAMARRIATNDPAPDTYAAYLQSLYTSIRASVPMLEAAERVAVERSPTDPVAAGIVDYLREHIEEERHHDEWVLDDYAATGRDPDELLTQAGSPTVAAMVGSVYYWIHHAHPIAMLGYCAVLEGFPPTGALIEEFQNGTEYPDTVFSTLRHHATIDVAHGAELFGLLDDLPVTAEQEALLAAVALQTANLTISMGEEILDAIASAGLP
ncbi:MAG: iron-containing redox enzyme family protein [Acidimicrobiia bacterium]